MAIFLYKPTTFEGPGGPHLSPVSALAPVTTHDAMWWALQGPASIQPPQSAVPSVQPTSDLGSMLQQTQVQLSSILSQISSAQSLGPRSKCVALNLPHEAQVCSPPSLGGPPVSQPVALMAMMSSPERSLMLGNGTILRFTVESIPDPPAVSFASNIPQLNSMWDDQTEHWCGTSPLIVSGHPIAVSYWPELYKYRKKDQWKGTKAKWFEWKVSSCCFVELY
jgi:hypothetical protein